MSTFPYRDDGKARQQQARGPRELCRIGKAQMNQGNLHEALNTLGLAARLAPQEPVCWDLLGFCHARMGSFEQALKAHQKAFEFSPKPPQVALFLNMISSMKLLGRSDVMDSALRDALAAHPDDPLLINKMSASLRRHNRFEEAQDLLERGLAANPGSPLLMIELGIHYERSNQLGKFDALVADMGDPGDVGELNLLKAWHLRRRHGIADAAAYLPKSRTSGGRAYYEQLCAELAEHEGRFAEAMDHYAAMNRAILLTANHAETDSYRDKLVMTTRDMLPPPGPPVPFAGRSPAFVVGSPRSGTTLIDTLLLAHPDVVVSEEQAMRSQLEIEFRGLERTTDPALIATARARYFELAEQIVGPIGGRLLVDKHPLHMANMPLLNRLFPDAPIVLVERHPCAATLSCFTTAFQPNRAMRSYSTLEDSARTYDALFSNWSRARELLPLNVHEVRYERMIEDLEGELRPLISFLGLEWNSAVLDNQSAAANRGRVLTASYAQIHQPLYKRAREHWRNFSEQLKPVMPILMPWIDRMGYEI